MQSLELNPVNILLKNFFSICICLILFFIFTPCIIMCFVFLPACYDKVHKQIKIVKLAYKLLNVILIFHSTKLDLY